MAQTVGPLAATEDRARLAAIATARRNMAREARVSRPAVWRWQQRYAEEGVDGLLRDKTRKPGKAPTPDDTVRRVVALTCSEPAGEATHWRSRAMAEATGLSLPTVQRIWDAHDLQPHRLRTFKRSKDPDFVAKLDDIVGLYVDPARHAVVLSVDEKSQIQALDRTQPGLPIKPGKAGTMTHDYVRHGTTTLFAALNVLDGTIIGRCMQRHRHQEFISFLGAVEAAVPGGLVIHVILDNDATHKHPKVQRWLARHPRWTFHFTPTSGSPRPSPDGRRSCRWTDRLADDRWLNALESFVSAMPRRPLRRGVCRSQVDLQAAIHQYLADHNVDPRPFTWTAAPASIHDKLARAKASVYQRGRRFVAIGSRG